MDQVIELTSDFKKAPLGRAVPGAFFDRDLKAWALTDPTPRGAAVALKLFPELSLRYPELAAERDKLAQDVRPRDYARELGLHIGAAAVREQLHAEDKDLYEFQSVDGGYIAAVLEKHGGAYIGHERGLGKTLSACALIDELECSANLIVAPNTAKASVWEPELRRWCPWLEIIVLPNQKLKRERCLAHVRQLRKAGTDLALIVHYEALAILEKERWWGKLGEWDLIVADEAHRIKNPKAKMTRALKKVKGTYKLALSGSIIENHAEELFSPLQWLFPDRYSSKWRDWNDRFLDYVDSGYGRVCIGVKHDRLDDLREELGVLMVYRRKEDELDLPAKTEQDLYVELSPAQRKAYEELKATCLTQLDDDTIVKAQDGLVMLTRLRQIATGLDTLGDSVQDSAKLDLAIELIEDNEDEAFVVFSWFKAAGRSLAERLVARGIPCYIIDGDVPHEERARVIEEFQGGGDRVLIGTISTMGESVTLHRATNAIFLDRSWNPSANTQSEDRIYRIGQERPVTIQHIIAKDTVDEFRVSPALANKSALRALILGAKR